MKVIHELITEILSIANRGEAIDCGITADKNEITIAYNKLTIDAISQAVAVYNRMYVYLDDRDRKAIRKESKELRPLLSGGTIITIDVWYLGVPKTKAMLKQIKDDLGELYGFRNSK